MEEKFTQQNFLMMANAGIVELRIVNYIKSYTCCLYAIKILKIPRVSLLRKNKKFELPSPGLKSDLVIPRSENKEVATYSSKLNLVSRVISNR